MAFRFRPDLTPRPTSLVLVGTSAFGIERGPVAAPKVRSSLVTPSSSARIESATSCCSTAGAARAARCLRFCFQKRRSSRQAMGPDGDRRVHVTRTGSVDAEAVIVQTSTHTTKRPWKGSAGRRRGRTGGGARVRRLAQRVRGERDGDTRSWEGYADDRHKEVLSVVLDHVRSMTSMLTAAFGWSDAWLDAPCRLCVGVAMTNRSPSPRCIQ